MPHVQNPWAARSWLRCGYPMARPEVGCIVVFWRGEPDGWSGHVGFVVGQDGDGNLMVCGGNQGDAVSIAAFRRARVLGYRWPVLPLPAPAVLPIVGGVLSQSEA